MKLFSYLFCKHDFEFKRNIYGDEINFLNGRSIWNCKKCNKEKIGQYLHEEIK